MSDERFDRIEAKLDKISDAIITHVTEDKAVHFDVGVLITTVEKLKTKQDKQDGATAFIGFLAVSGILALVVTEIMRHWKA